MKPKEIRVRDIHIRLTEEELDLIEQSASRYMMPASAFSRYAILMFIKRKAGGQ